MNETSRETSIITDISQNLSAFFRHLLPGVFILGAACIAHPSWFIGVDAKSWHHILIVGVIALVVGNILYSINRYGVEQLLDYAFYFLKCQGPKPKQSRQYLDDLSNHVAAVLWNSDIPERAREHVRFRTSAVLLLFMVAEVSLIFALWHESNTFFSGYQRETLVTSIVLVLVGVCQYRITRSIDFHVTTKVGK